MYSIGIYIIYIYMKNTGGKKAFALGAVLVIAGAGFFFNFSGNNETNTVRAATLTVYKSPSCGCCGNYVAYMKKEGYDVEVIDTEDMDAIKDQYGIPEFMRSCHTSVVGDGEYVVEGHIPAKGVQELMKGNADVDTIAMPGMPSGSPGMPGPKLGAFTVYSIDSEGNASQFMQL